MTDGITLAPCPTEREQFEAWWEREGQFCRAGGGSYEKTFAFQAWQARAQAAPQGPALVPLTAVQMAAGREAIFSTDNPYCPCDNKTFRKVAEWVERHHGITGAPNAQT